LSESGHRLGLLPRIMRMMHRGTKSGAHAIDQRSSWVHHGNGTFREWTALNIILHWC
jgi:hypothetical protein